MALGPFWAWHHWHYYPLIWRRSNRGSSSEVAWLGLSSIYVSRILLMDHDYRIQNPADLNYYVRRLRLEDFSKPYVRLVLGDYVRMRSRDELVSIAELHSDIETIIMAAHMKIPEALNDEMVLPAARPKIKIIQY